MAITITINSVDRLTWAKVGSLSIRRNLNGRDELSVVLEDKGRGYKPAMENEIIVTNGATREFAGNIREIRRAKHGRTDKMQYILSCVDYNWILDERRVFSNFGTQSFYDLVQRVMSKISGEGITSTTNVENPGSTITDPPPANYETVRQYFQKISQLTGYLFKINYFKDLAFGPFTATAAPITLTNSTPRWRNMVTDESMASYRNRQYGRTQYRINEEVTKNFTGDGSTRDFFLNVDGEDGFFYNAPSITVGGVPQTVGRVGYDPIGDFDWYYDVDGPGIHNFAPDPPVGFGVAIAVTYVGIFGNVVVQEDAAEIAARQAAAGGTGIREAIEEQRSVPSRTALNNLAAGALRQYGGIPVTGEFEIDGVGGIQFLPGQRLTINLPEFDLNDVFLIEQVDSVLVQAGTPYFAQKVRFTSREPYGYPSEMFDKLIEMARIGPDAGTVEQGSADPVGRQVYLPDEVTISGATPVSSPGTPRVGDLAIIRVKQDGAGGGTISWSSAFHNTMPTFVGPDPDARSVFFVVGNGAQWEYVSSFAGL